jgi:ABC-type dipeptide/oligopeptide/nickel transport system permease component
VIVGFTMAIIAVYLVVDLVSEIVTLSLDPRIDSAS